MIKSSFKFVLYSLVAVYFSISHAGSYEDFFRAVEVDNAGTVTELLALGFDPNTPSEDGQVALYLAMRSDSPKVAAALLASPKTEVDAMNKVGETPLMMAALRGRLEWSQRLLDKGAKVQKDGWSPVHYAATGPEPKVVALLLDRGANINAESPNRTTPLMMAARYGSEDSVMLLLGRGADKTLRNDQNLSAADFAKLGEREYLLKALQ